MRLLLSSFNENNANNISDESKQSEWGVYIVHYYYYYFIGKVLCHISILVPRITVSVLNCLFVIQWINLYWFESMILWFINIISLLPITLNWIFFNIVYTLFVFMRRENKEQIMTISHNRIINWFYSSQGI